MPTPKKPVEVDVGGQPKKIWYRYQLRKAMRVSEPTFKRRLMLLQKAKPKSSQIPLPPTEKIIGATDVFIGTDGLAISQQQQEKT